MRDWKKRKYILWLWEYVEEKKTNREEILVPQTSLLMVHSRSFSVHWASGVEVVAVSEVWFHCGPRTLETSLKCLSRGTKNQKKKKMFTQQNKWNKFIKWQFATSVKFIGTVSVSCDGI